MSKRDADREYYSKSPEQRRREQRENDRDAKMIALVFGIPMFFITIFCLIAQRMGW